MNLPPVRLVRQSDTHRLIPSKYSVDAESVLTQIADNDRHLQDLFDLDHATNDRLWAENDYMPGISSHELLFGVPFCGVVNASFTHAHPLGSRFNSSDRGAWYAGFELGTAQAEVAFHKTQEYVEINRFDDSVSYDDYLADFSGEFHDIRNAASFSRYLDPNSYVSSQHLAEELLTAGSLGIVYPAVRKSNGTCIGCFRPAAVGMSAGITVIGLLGWELLIPRSVAQAGQRNKKGGGRDARPLVVSEALENKLKAELQYAWIMRSAGMEEVGTGHAG